MSAPAYRSYTSFAGDGGSHLRSSVQVDKPSGLADGDYILAVINIAFGTNALAITSLPDAGWTLLCASGAISRSSGYQYIWVYGRLAGASEPSSWTWGLNNSVAFYNFNGIAFSGVNVSTPYEGLSVAGGVLTSGQTLTRTTITTAPDRLLCTLFLAGGSSPTWSESAGTEVFESTGSENGVTGSTVVNTLNTVLLSSPATQTVIGTETHGGGTTIGAVVVQLAFITVRVDATVVSPVALASAARGTIAAVFGVVVPAAAAVASRASPFTTGAQTAFAVPATAVASRGSPHAFSSRVAIGLYPNEGGVIELVEDP